ncbi:hypothetical protein AB0H36_05275 [Kribbella sp. NPDC050820]|uniref:hypothetical protein n=1 Tax=Kribbella sp. NPDC050820 TaxID=3155408 RepID=UPI00340986B2
MIGRRFPVAPGYVRRYPGLSARELGELQRRLAEVAKRHGRTLGTVYVEELPSDPKAFEELLVSLKRLDAPAVVIPSKAHLGRWDLPGSKYEQLQQSTETKVIVADQSP